MTRANPPSPPQTRLPLEPEPRLLTIGYEGRNLEQYLELVREAGVTLLCDVRRDPVSRKPGFSKRRLEQACAAADIRYVHLRELGIAKERRQDVRTAADYEALFAWYMQEALPAQAEAVARIRGWIEDGERVALTCYERDPARCHRRLVAEAVVAGRPTALDGAVGRDGIQHM